MASNDLMEKSEYFLSTRPTSAGLSIDNETTILPGTPRNQKRLLFLTAAQTMPTAVISLEKHIDLASTTTHLSIARILPSLMNSFRVPPCYVYLIQLFKLPPINSFLPLLR
jgi:hypothetical protein